MPRILTGAQIERPPGPKYLDSLRFAELTFAGPTPKPGTLRKWRADLPDDFVLSLVCPKTAWHSARGAFRFDEAMHVAFGKLDAALAALEVDFLVVPTGGTVTTGQRDRDLLAAWVARLEAAGRLEGRCRVVWHPGGLWEPELASGVARKLGPNVLAGIDPLHSEPVEGPLYGRLMAVGQRNKFGETQLLEVADRIGSREEAWIAIRSAKSFREAQRLAELIASSET